MSSLKKKMSSGHDVPCIGFGTWRIPQEITKQVVIDAINSG